MAKSTEELLFALGIKAKNESICTGREWITSLGTDTVAVYTPVTGEKLADVVFASQSEYEHVVKKAQEAFEFWKKVPAPERGDIIRKYGVKLRLRKKDLGRLVSLEMGKSYQEGLGEVQEMIDICDFAVGLS